MTYKLPKPTYAAPIAALALVGAVSMAQEEAALTDWWQGIPFAWIAAVCVVFWFGLIVQDLYNPRSWIRHNWREWRRVFDVPNLHTHHVSGEDEYVEILCRIVFRKRLIDPLLTVRVIWPIGVPDPSTWVVHQERLGDVVKDSNKRLRLGSLQIPRPGWIPKHSVWGEKLGERDLGDQRTIGTGSPSIIELTVDHQSYRAMVDRAPDDERRRLYILTEDEARELQLPLGIGP